MVTLKFTKADITKMANYCYGPNDDVRFGRPENFIFNDYMIEIKENKDIQYTTSMERNTNTLTICSVDPRTGKKCILVKAEGCYINNDGQLHLDSFDGKYLELLYNYDRLKDKEAQKKLHDLIIQELITVTLVEKYIMTKLSEQKTDIEYVRRDLKRIISGQRQNVKKKGKNVKKPIIINLGDIERTINVNKGTKPYERHIDSWEVRGHYRHYKSGKIVFIKSYVKGNKEVKPLDKEYEVR